MTAGWRAANFRNVSRLAAGPWSTVADPAASRQLRALEAEARERILRQADDALYARRQAEAEKRNVRVVHTMSNRTKAGDQLRTIVGLYNDGTFRAPELTVLPLEQAGEAHRRVKDGHVRGKIVLHVADL